MKWMSTFLTMVTSITAKRILALTMHAGSACVLGIAIFQYLVTVGSRLESTTFVVIGLASLALLCGFSLLCRYDDLVLISFENDREENRGHRSIVFYSVLIGWTVVLSLATHWSLAIGFVALAFLLPTIYSHALSQRAVPENDLGSSREVVLEPLSSMTDSENEGFEDETFPMDVTRQVVHTKIDNRSMVTAYVRHHFSAEQKSDVIHVPLHPALEREPTTEVLQVEGPDAKVRVTQSSRFGIRAEIALDQAATEKTELLFEFTITEPEHQALAKAG